MSSIDPTFRRDVYRSLVLYSWYVCRGCLILSEQQIQLKKPLPTPFCSFFLDYELMPGFLLYSKAGSSSKLGERSARLLMAGMPSDGIML